MADATYQVMEIDPPVPEKKIFEGCFTIFAILVMWPGCREQTFVPPTQGGSTSNLALIGQAVLKKKMFENMKGWTRTMGKLKAHLWAEPSAHVS